MGARQAYTGDERDKGEGDRRAESGDRGESGKREKSSHWRLE